MSERLANLVSQFKSTTVGSQPGSGMAQGLSHITSRNPSDVVITTVSTEILHQVEQSRPFELLLPEQEKVG